MFLHPITWLPLFVPLAVRFAFICFTVKILEKCARERRLRDPCFEHKANVEILVLHPGSQSQDLLTPFVPAMLLIRPVSGLLPFETTESATYDLRKEHYTRHLTLLIRACTSLRCLKHSQKADDGTLASFGVVRTHMITVIFCAH